MKNVRYGKLIRATNTNTDEVNTTRKNNSDTR